MYCIASAGAAVAPSRGCDGKRARIRRDIITDAPAIWPGGIFVRTTGYSIQAGGVGTGVRRRMAFSNSVAIGRNTLAGG